MSRCLVVLLAWLLVALAPARAAEIEVDRDDDGIAVVTVVGELAPEDGRRFRLAIRDVEAGIVLFDSDGGAVLAGIEIGEAIRLRNMWTAVPPGSACASACALAWLGGARRLKSEAALVGFHAAWIDEGGGARESGAANALVGKYLADLGLSRRAIFFATMSAPDEMAWLTPEVARDVGIAFDAFEDVFPDAGPRTAAGPQGPEAQALRFVEEHFAAAGDDRTAWLGRAARVYAPTVRYHGEVRSRHEVLADLRRFDERWPERLYGLREPPTIDCDRDRRTCRVEGVGVYEAASPARRAISNGVFTFVFRLRLGSDGTVRILEEESLVIDRLVADMPEGGDLLVTLIQVNLARLGCEPGAIDGAWGPATAAALSRFDRATGGALARAGPAPQTLFALERGPIGACLPARAPPGRTLAMLPGKDLPGGDYRIVRQVPLGTCQSRCLSDRRCAAFTFDERHEWCFLKDRVAEPRDFREAISGVVREGTITVRPLR